MDYEIKFLVPGEKVIGSFSGSISGGVFRRVGVVKSVGKISVTCLFGDESFRFDKNGWGTGVGYHRPSIAPATPELIEEVKKENRDRCVLRTLSDLNWSTLSSEQLGMAYKALSQIGIISNIKK